MGLFGFGKKKEIAQKVNEEVSGFTPAEETIVSGQSDHDLNWDEALPSFKRSDSLDVPITRIPQERDSNLDFLAMDANLKETVFPQEPIFQEVQKPVDVSLSKEEVVSSKGDSSFVKGNSIFMDEESYASFYFLLEEIKKGFLEISKGKAQARGFENGLKLSSNEMAKSVSNIAKLSLECEEVIKKGGESA